MTSPLLEFDNVSKFFGGLAAVKNLTFNVKKSEFLGIIGPNGAGKTTVFNIITGRCKPNDGKVIFDGHDITGLPPHKICRLGVGRTHQIPQPFWNMTVTENLLVSARHGGGFNHSDASKLVVKTGDSTGLTEKMDWFVRDLLLYDLKRVELARALASKPKLLLIDEVAAGLDEVEVEKLLELTNQINKSGTTIILIEHEMRVILKTVTRLLVLDKGEKLIEGDPASVMNSEKVINVYLGKEWGK